MTTALRPLRPAQVRALEYAKVRQRIALFMEMRLGKSAVAIRWAKHHRLDRILLIAPSTVLPGWQEELLTEQVPVSYIHVLQGTTRQRLIVAEEVDTGWVLMNPEAIRYIPDVLALPWSGVIIDESTVIRNPQAKVSKLLLRRTGHIPYRAVLSGLPNPESSLDYYNQIAFLEGDFLNCRNYWIFRQRHYELPVGSYEWQPIKGTDEAIKREVHRVGFVLTRKAAGVGEHKVYETRVVEMTREQRNAYFQIMRKFKFKEQETQWATVQHLWMARVAGGFSPDQEHPQLLSDTKLMELDKLVREELRNESIVVWFRFNEELHMVRHWLQSHGVPLGTITGDDALPERKATVAAFQSGKIRVVLAQIACAKFGLNMSRSSTAIYYSNSYALEDRKQSEDRILDVGRAEPLLFIDLVTRNTVDEGVVAALKEKSLDSRRFAVRLASEIRLQYDAVYRGASSPGAIPSAYVQETRTRINRVFPKDRRF